MLPRRRTSLLMIAAAAAALSVLGVLAPRHLALPGAQAPEGGVPGTRETAGRAATTTPAEGLLAAQNLEYAPGLDPFQVEAFLYGIGSDLAAYVVVQGERHIPFTELVSSAAQRHAVNPRVLLILLELATGAVSAPSPEVVMRAAGYSPGEAPDAQAQIERLAATLSSHYVAAFMGDEVLAVRGPDGPVTVAGTDPAPAAIARTLAETLPLSGLGVAVSGEQPAFSDLYRQWFGDPAEVPVFARGVSLPADAAWPFEGARRHTGGPHLGAFCSQQDILAASGLDFGGESHKVLAMADGRYLGRGETRSAGLQAGKYVLIEHAGGVQVMYWHLAGFTPEVLKLAPGAEIPKGYPVGWSGRSGNQLAVHLHAELRRGAVASNPYSGVRISWDGQTVDGWTVRMYRWPGRTDRGISYRGSAVRGAARSASITNSTCRQSGADAMVSAQHPGTSTPRNGMDGNTVLANYPDVGLLPSSNVRTTALWATTEKSWRQRLTWYYLVDASVGGADRVRLNETPLFSPPDCARALWLGAGEQRLTWRYLDEGGGPPAVGIRPWPFQAPACAAEALGEPPAYDAPPATPHDDAASAGEAVPGAVGGEAGDAVAVTWRLRNTGTTAWGHGYRLTFDHGWPLGPADGAPLPAAAPGEEVTVTLAVASPDVRGRTHAVWRLRRPDGVAFGPALAGDVGGPGVAPAPPAGDTSPATPRGAPALLEPLAPEGAIAHLAGREVTLRWSGVEGARGYELYLGLTPAPRDDPSPVHRERLGAEVQQRRLLFGVDVARLYWQVVAMMPDGEVASGVAAFGLDTGAPSCAAAIESAHRGGASVTWAAQDDLSGVASVDVAYRAAGEGTWRPLIGDGPAEGVGVPLAARGGGAYAVRCRARDVAGNVGPWSVEREEASADLGAAPPADVAVQDLTATALPGGRLLVEALARNVGQAAGDAALALMARRGDVAVEAHRWDVADLVPGGAITLTAAIDGPPAVASASVPLDADYYLSVHALPDGAPLAVLPGACLAAPDAYEAWDVAAGGAPQGAALAPGGRQTRGLHAPWDADYAQVVTTAGGRYVLWVERVGPAVDVVIELYDPAGRRVAGADGAADDDARIAWTASADGVYRVGARAWAQGSEGCGAGYTLRLQTDPPVAEAPEEGLGRVSLPVIVRPE